MNDAGAGGTVEAADIAAILSHLPHRYPFLMIDRIVDIRGDDYGVGIKNVTYNEPQFQGHFPGTPVMPGVLLIEGMAQTAGVLCIMTLKERRNRLVYFMTIDKAKFRKPVVPGDTVEYHMRKIRSRGQIWKFFGEARVGGVKVAEAELSAMTIEQSLADVRQPPDRDRRRRRRDRAGRRHRPLRGRR
jgi:3-hydroxyacyl-[acyl-carrier-protein] dehydratase